MHAAVQVSLKEDQQSEQWAEEGQSDQQVCEASSSWIPAHLYSRLQAYRLNQSNFLFADRQSLFSYLSNHLGFNLLLFSLARSTFHSMLVVIKAHKLYLISALLSHIYDHSTTLFAPWAVYIFVIIFNLCEFFCSFQQTIVFCLKSRKHKHPF